MDGYLAGFISPHSQHIVPKTLQTANAHTHMDSHRDTRHHSTPIPKQTQHENNLWQAMTTH